MIAQLAVAADSRRKLSPAGQPPKLKPENVLLTEIMKRANYHTGVIASHEYWNDWGMDQGVDDYDNSIGKTPDPSLKALGYNVLGDVYFAKGQKRDAMWSYLWVDVVYNQDRGEQLKAMTRLIRIFEADNDKEKAQMYKEKLSRSR